MAMFGLVNLIILLILVGLSIAALVLFIILTLKGIKALDLYIKEKEQ